MYFAGMGVWVWGGMFPNYLMIFVLFRAMFGQLAGKARQGKAETIYSDSQDTTGQ